MKSCLEYAIYYLSRYPKTEQEMIAQLRKKGYHADEIDEVMPQLIELHYIDDQKFAYAYLTSEVVRKGKSLAIVQYKLYQKGIDKSLVAQHVSEMECELHEGMQQKLAKLIDRMDEKGYDELTVIQKLQQRGYWMNDIKLVIETRSKVEN